MGIIVSFISDTGGGGGAVASWVIGEGGGDGGMGDACRLDIWASCTMTDFERMISSGNGWIRSLIRSSTRKSKIKYEKKTVSYHCSTNIENRSMSSRLETR